MKLKQWILTGLVLMFVGHASVAQVPKGDRTLAWQVDLPQSGNYDTAFHMAKNACMESVHLFFKWNDLEPDTGVFDQAFIASFLDVINLYYPLNGTSVELQMAVTNTVAKEVPSELQSLPFEHPDMIRHFKRALDTMFYHIPFVDLVSLNIGNESDILFGVNAKEYTEFNNFLDSITPYAKQWYSAIHGTELKIGTTFTHTGLTQPISSQLCQQVNANRDIISVTYYPLDSDFTMRPPTDVGHDFSELVQLYPDTSQPIYFAECGYASSPTCNSSEQQQSDFYYHMFNAWDSLQDNIKYMTIFKTHDWSQATVDTLGLYYGISDSVFLEYLRTLGVNTYFGNGSPKKAFFTISCELHQRNWCPTANCLLGLGKEKANSWIVFPNPTNSMLRLEFDEDIEGPIEIYDSKGKLILIHEEGAGVIDVSSWGPGIFFLRPRDPSYSPKRIIVN